MEGLSLLLIVGVIILVIVFAFKSMKRSPAISSRRDFERAIATIGVHSLNVSGKDLSRCDLSSLPLAGIDFTNTNLLGATFRKTDLSRAKLVNANLSSAKFSDAILAEANLYDADLSRADLTEADLSNANLAMANLKGANLQSAQLVGVAFADTVYDHKTVWPKEMSKMIASGMVKGLILEA